jgi:hypothetical protein
MLRFQITTGQIFSSAMSWYGKGRGTALLAWPDDQQAGQPANNPKVIFCEPEDDQKINLTARGAAALSNTLNNNISMR